MTTPKDLISVLNEEQRFLIAAHVNPDGDAIGSALALSSALESIGKETVTYSRDPIPRQYSFLPGIDNMRNSLDGASGPDPVLILVDCNTPERAGLGGHTFRRALVIDHHATESDFGNVRWIEHGSAATGLMVYELIKTLGLQITKEIAWNLYTAICIDTGTFRYGNTSAEVLRVAADLVDAGADPELIPRRLYEEWDLRRFNLMVMMLKQLKIRNGVALCYVTTEMLDKTGATAEDTENFSNIPRIIATVKVSVLLREVRSGGWKVSLRSKGDVDVSAVAQELGGGGHKNAAGFQISGDLNSAKRAVLAMIKKKIK